MGILQPHGLNWDSKDFATARTVALAESAPTVVTDGIACWGYQRVQVMVYSLTAITTWSGQLYLYGGPSADKAWVKANNCDFNLMGNNTFTEWFDLSGWERYVFTIDALTGTSLKVAGRVT
jgi:hypothetical protein